MKGKQSHKMGHHSGGERGHNKGLHERGHHESHLKDHASHGVPTSHGAFEKLGNSSGIKGK